MVCWLARVCKLWQVATGSREQVIDLFDVRNKVSPYHHRKRLTGHSSSVTKLDWSADSKVGGLCLPQVSLVKRERERRKKKKKKK